MHETKGVSMSLEPITLVILMQYNGWLVSELPFLKPIAHELPDWCKTAKMNIESVSTLPDLDFLRTRPSACAKRPMPLTRPDTAWYASYCITSIINSSYII